MGSGGAGTAGGKCGDYTPRQPLATALHRAVSDGLPLFLEQAQAHGGVPRFVTPALQRYLSCAPGRRGGLRAELHLGTRVTLTLTFRLTLPA